MISGKKENITEAESVHTCFCSSIISEMQFSIPQEVHGTNLPALHQLTSGLNIHGLLAAIRNNKTAFEEYFVVIENWSWKICLVLCPQNSEKTEVISLKRKWIFTSISPTSYNIVAIMVSISVLHFKHFIY